MVVAAGRQIDTEAHTGVDVDTRHRAVTVAHLNVDASSMAGTRDTGRVMVVGVALTEGETTTNDGNSTGDHVRLPIGIHEEAVALVACKTWLLVPMGHVPFRTAAACGDNVTTIGRDMRCSAIKPLPMIHTPKQPARLRIPHHYHT